MAFTIRNAASSGDPQATPDKVDFDIFAQGLAGEGVVSGCACTVATGMDVAVASGVVRIAGVNYTVASGNVTVATPHATLRRFSLIIATGATKSVVNGTAATIPAFPAAGAVLGTSVVLCAVLGVAGASSLVSGNLEDKRVILPPAPTEVIGVALSDETTTITAGTNKAVWRAPFALTLTAVRASLSTVSSAGVVTVDINEAGTSILGTKLTIDATERSSTTAAAPATITDSALADDAELSFDIDTAGTGAKGLKVSLYGVRA